MKSSPHQANPNGPGRLIGKLLILIGFMTSLLGASPPIGDLNRREFSATDTKTVTENVEKQRNPSYLPPRLDHQDLVDPSIALGPSPTLSEEERLQLVRAEEVLSDPMGRIDKEFEISPAMRQRVEFWFDIYTRYGSDTYVIHHSRYPWIVFDVVDLRERMAAQTKGPQWLRRQRAENYLKQRKFDIRVALRHLASHPHRFRSELERSLAHLLGEIPGKRKSVYSLAASSVRSQLGQRDFFIAGLRRSSRYMPMLEENFSSRGVPTELTRVPFVESSFNVAAYSKVGASGIWQIMPPTGRAYGLVTPQIDERNSPVKASAMAARLLHSYYRALKSWPLAITSYNHGIGNIQKAIKAARSRDLDKIIARYHQGDFKFASSNFYACFLAALHAEKYSEVVFPSVVRDPSFNTVQLKITRPIGLRAFLKKADVSVQDIFAMNLDLNPKFMRQVRFPRGYVLYVPAEKAERVVQSLEGSAMLLEDSRITGNRDDQPSSI